jgi:hypothetical protein
MTTSTPGLSIGPMDLDNSSQLTSKLGVHNKAHILLQRAAANFPLELTKALSRPTDMERTLAVQEHRDEVETAARATGSWLRTTDVVEDLSVKGTSDADRILVVLFRNEAGRSGRGILPYDEVPAVERTHVQLRREARQQAAIDAGIPVAASSDDDRVKAMETQSREAVAESEAKRLKAEADLKDVLDRLAKLEDPEPFPGYAELNAPDIAKQLKDGGREQYGVVGLEKIVEYERAHQNRKSVLEAVTDAQTAPASAG